MKRAVKNSKMIPVLEWWNSKCVFFYCLTFLSVILLIIKTNYILKHAFQKVMYCMISFLQHSLNDKTSGGGMCEYIEVTLGSSFVVMEQFCILIMVVVTQNYTWDKIAQNYTYTQRNAGLKNCKICMWSVLQLTAMFQYQFPGFHIVWQLFKMSPLGKLNEEYIGPYYLCNFL